MSNIQVFEPNPDAVYTIDLTARLAAVPRHTILVYCKHGLVRPVTDEQGAYHFNDDAIRILRQVEHLRVSCGLNLAGIKVALDLLHEVERLQTEIRFLRR
jgi:DNA-binding transcriptional MerR regulator